MRIPSIKNLLTVVLSVVCLLLPVGSARAELYNELQALVSQAQTLDAQLKSITLTADSVCGPLVAANQSARDLVNSIAVVNQELAAPLQIDSTTLASLETLSSTTVSLANESLRLSLDLKNLTVLANAFTLKDGMVAMLQLSDDIGSMADRIGEMADKILVMSDNIGLMADRILVTQQLQNQNILLVQQGLLQTQQNSLAIVSVVETATTDLSISQLIVEGNLLAAQLSAIVLNPFTMKTQLQYAAASVRSYLDKVKAAHATVLAQSTDSTSYVSSMSLLHQQNLAIMTTSLGTVLEGYMVAISGIQAITSSSNLADSLKSMLQMSADIGLMGNRILEMGDVILVMADNIGMVADQILVAQQLQSANLATTQASVLAAQLFAVNLIKTRSL